MTSCTPDAVHRRNFVLAGLSIALLLSVGFLVYSPVEGRPARAWVAWAKARMKMVDEQIVARGVRDPRVLLAMRRVRRHAFVPRAHRRDAYEDKPLPIGHRQTISQPYIVAVMTELLQVSQGDRVLEVGTGSGYQAAVLAELGATVYSIEIIESLANRASKTLSAQGYQNVKVRFGDGFAGWPSEAPFDGIIVTAAPAEVPPPLLEQLKPGGRLVIPVGDEHQVLRVFERAKTGELSGRRVFGVRFVPMTGRAQDASE